MSEIATSNSQNAIDVADVLNVLTAQAFEGFVATSLKLRDQLDDMPEQYRHKLVITRSDFDDLYGVLQPIYEKLKI